MDKAYWDRVADRFDEEVMKILDRDRSGVLASAISVASSSRKTVADFGCGNGSLLGLLAERFHTVDAIDHSVKLLDQARRQNADHKNIQYIQADLADHYVSQPKVDVLVCVNVVIHPDINVRDRIIENAAAAIKARGTLICVVPAYESLIHTYQTIVETNVALGIPRPQAIAEVEEVYKAEIVSPVDGIVTLGGEPTKLHTLTEISTSLADVGLDRIVPHRVEYDWDEMIDDAPEGMRAPYPWDWLLVARKL